MISLAARAFASEGWTVLQLDHLGCGDSAGDFAEATWQGWVQDLELGWRWLIEDAKKHSPSSLPVVLWSLRAGSLLAAEWLSTGDERPPLLMWQPVTSGKQHLTQFLRLKAANEMLAESDARQSMAAVRASLQKGQCVEIAGYELSADLAAGMDVASLRVPDDYPASITLLEIVGGDRVEPSPAVANLVAKWADSGINARTEVVAGPGFWQTQEIETVPMLIDRSVRILGQLVT